MPGRRGAGAGAGVAIMLPVVVGSAWAVSAGERLVARKLGGRFARLFFLGEIEMSCADVQTTDHDGDHARGDEQRLDAAEQTLLERGFVTGGLVLLDIITRWRRRIFRLAGVAQRGLSSAAGGGEEAGLAFRRGPARRDGVAERGL